MQRDDVQPESPTAFLPTGATTPAPPARTVQGASQPRPSHLADGSATRRCSRVPARLLARSDSTGCAPWSRMPDRAYACQRRFAAGGASTGREHRSATEIAPLFRFICDFPVGAGSLQPSDFLARDFRMRPVVLFSTSDDTQLSRGANTASPYRAAASKRSQPGTPMMMRHSPLTELIWPSGCLPPPRCELSTKKTRQAPIGRALDRTVCSQTDALAGTRPFEAGQAIVCLATISGRTGDENDEPVRENAGHR